MFRHRKDARAPQEEDRRTVAPDRAVHTAEGLVRRAWALELARRHEREEFTLHIERGNYDAAIAILAAAQRDGDPTQIGAARGAVLQALDCIRAATAARGEARRMLRKELRSLARRPKKLSRAIRASRPNKRRSKAAMRWDKAPDQLPPRGRSVLMALRSRIRRRKLSSGRLSFRRES